MVRNHTDRPDLVVDLEKELMHWATYDPVERDPQSAEQLRREITYGRAAFMQLRNTLRAAYRIHNMPAHHKALTDVRRPPWRQRAHEVLKEKERAEETELYAWILNTEYGKTVCRKYPPHELFVEYDEDDISIVTWGSK